MPRLRIRHLLALSLVCTPGAYAQNASGLSAQFSVLYNSLGGDDYTNINAGAGLEAQIRRRFGEWTMGIGGQYTRHSIDAAAGVSGHASLAGVFVEPRYVLSTSSRTAAPYLSLRLAFLRQGLDLDLFSGSSTGFQANAGGGLLIALSANTNLDLGATFGAVNFGDFKADQSNVQVETSSGSGTNLVLRVGLSVGLGR